MRGTGRVFSRVAPARTGRTFARGWARILAVGAAGAFGLVFLSAVVSAQAPEPDTRAEELRRQREQKAKVLAPYKPSGTERLLLWLEDSRSWERLLNPAEGFYPKIGSIAPGSGFSFGAGYRKPGLLGEKAAFSSVAMTSFKGYWLVDAQLRFPELAGGLAFAEAFGEAYDHQSEAFFGLGPESLRSSESYYGYRRTRFGGLGGIRLGPYASIGGGGEYLMPSIDRGKIKTPVQDRFIPAEAAGLDRQPDFGHYWALAEINTRQPRGNPRTGSMLAVRFARFDDREFNAYSFDQLEADVQQYLSFFNQRRVLALRGFVSSANAHDGNQVPFYLQHTLGGPDDLRGFRRHRFRDNHLLLLQAEYRWEVFTAMDAALFVDWGKVASRREDLDFKDLERDYGFGVRFGTHNGVFLRIEGAFGSRDGKHFVLRFGNAF